MVIKQQKWTINHYFKLVSKPLMPRSAFFAFEGQLCKMCDTYTLNFNRYLNKTTKPNNIQYKYSGWLRWKVCEFCFKCIEKKEYYDYTSIWLEIRKSKILAKYGDFSTLNLKTFMKIISSDPRYRKKAVKPYEPKHPIRTRIQQLGIMQMDLKILGMRETKCKKMISVFNMIDTSSRVVFGQYLNSQNAGEVIKAMDAAYDFFKNLGIRIRVIQTDNAMMFKNINFINWNQYAEWCNDHEVTKRTIPLGQPQCNGCVERFHLTIDKEQHTKLMTCKTIEDVGVVIKDYMHYCNNHRWHHYVELKKLPFVDRHLKPIDAIKYFSRYNSQWVVQNVRVLNKFFYLVSVKIHNNQ